MEVAHLAHQEAVPGPSRGGPPGPSRSGGPPDLPEAVHLQVVHQVAAAQPAVALHAVVLAVLLRVWALLVEVHQREVAHLVEDHPAAALAVHQSVAVLLVAAHQAVALVALQRKAALLAAAHPVQNVQDLQVQSVVHRSETHKLDLIQSCG